MSYERDSQEARHRARLYLMATAALVLAGAAVPACVTGIMHQRAHERSLQAEFNWRRWYEKSWLTGMKLAPMTIVSLFLSVQGASSPRIGPNRSHFGTARAFCERVPHRNVFTASW
jgi:hypothetical protein